MYLDNPNYAPISLSVFSISPKKKEKPIRKPTCSEVKIMSIHDFNTRKFTHIISIKHNNEAVIRVGFTFLRAEKKEARQAKATSTPYSK